MEKVSEKICKAYGFILRLCFFCAVVALVLAVNLAVKIHPIQGLWTDLIRFYRYLGI